MAVLRSEKREAKRGSSGLKGLVVALVLWFARASEGAACENCDCCRVPRGHVSEFERKVDEVMMISTSSRSRKCFV